MCLRCCYLSSPFSRLLSALPKSRNRFSVKEVKKKQNKRETMKKKKLWIALRMASFHPNKNTNPFHSLLSMRAKHGMISSKVAVVVFSNRRRSPFIFCCLADFFFLFHSSLNWWGAATDCYHFFFSWNCRNLMNAHWKTFSLSIMPFQLKWFLYFLVCLDIPRHGPKDRSITTDPYIYRPRRVETFTKNGADVRWRLEPQGSFKYNRVR